MAKLIGIDVSEHNGVLDWAKIKAAGISFAVVRTGYGISHTDNYFKRNIEGAIAQGIAVGAYHFSYALDVAGAKAEAEFALKLLEPYKAHIAMPIYYDFEYDTVSYAKKMGVSLGKNAFNTHTVAFCEAVKAAGYQPGVYYNRDYYNNMVALSSVGGYSQWYAQYASAPSISDYDLWQYSSSYSIPGVSGKFDVNVLKNEAILTGSTEKYVVGWHKDKVGWWYADTGSTYYKSRWAEIGGKWYYFDDSGYMEFSRWKVSENGDTYYLGADGAMVTNQLVGIGADGKLCPVEPYYHLISELPAFYRKEIDKLVDAGKLAGKSGSGDNLVLDLPMSAVRVLIILNRA